MQTMLRFFENAINALLPPRCVLCGQPSGSICICEPCKNDLPRTTPQCYQCGLPLPAGDGQTCGQCLKSPPFYDHAISPLRYTFPGDQLVRALKFHRQLAAGRVLAHLMCEQVKYEAARLPDKLIPVPLHHLRMIKRGFNQAFELGNYTSSVLGIPMQATGLRRKRNTMAQSGLNRKQRQSNVRGAFYWCGNRKPGRHIALIDDVMTTGTTVSECARVLKMAGAERVDVWVSARAIPARDTHPDTDPGQQAQPSVHGHTTHR